MYSSVLQCTPVYSSVLQCTPVHGLAGFFLAQIIACKQVIVRYRIVRFVCSRYRWISYRSVRSCNLSLDIVSLVSRVQDYRRLLSRSCWDLWKSCRAVSLIREISANVVRRSTNGANLEEAQLWGISHKGRFSLGCPEAPEATIIIRVLEAKCAHFTCLEPAGSWNHASSWNHYKNNVNLPQRN